MNHQPDNDDLANLAPNLARIPKVDPFRVEEGFFERFPHQVQALVALERKGRSIPSWSRRLALAVPVLALLIGAWWFFRPVATLPSAEPTITAGTLSTDELYLLEEAALLADLTAEELPEHAATTEAPVLDADELAAYYELTGADVTDLIENL